MRIRLPGTVAGRAALRQLAVGIGVTALGIGVVLGVRSAYTDHYEESRHYDSVLAVPSHNGVFALPDWVPDDASDITVNAQTRGLGRSITLTSREDLARGCSPAPAPVSDPVPSLDLPDAVRSSPGDRCGDWFVARSGTAVTAWEAYR